MGMTLIVKTIARLIVGLIFTYGSYIVFHGHLTPGGGFAGGVIIAGAFVLMILALGLDEKSVGIKKFRASFYESTGIFLFWLLALFGIFVGTFFFSNILTKGKPWHLFSGGIIPLCNIAIGIEVAGALVAVVITLAVLRTGGKE